MTNRLCTNRPVISVGRPIDLTGQATGRRVVFNNYHVFVFLFFGLLDSVGQLIPAHEVHLLPTHTIMLNQRPGPMAFVPTGGTHYVLLISDAETPAAAAAATRCCNTCYRLLSEESEDSAVIYWRGLPMLHTAAAALIPGSTTIHTKVNVAATFRQEVSPVWACLPKLSPAAASGPNQGKNVKCCLRRGDGKECPMYQQRHQGFDQTNICTRTTKVEVGSLREQQISKREKSTRRGARRGIR